MTKRLLPRTSAGISYRHLAVLAILAACLDSDRIELPSAEQAAVDAALVARVAASWRR